MYIKKQSIIQIILIECPNACSSHGICGAFDACICYKDWMGGDCSQRICQFGRAYVDIPKGDIDASKTLTGPSVIVAENSQLYPYGTTELFPNMVDSRNNVLQNTAHDYAECSNMGECDRDSGVCNCLPGFEGPACERMKCPTIDKDITCSGHGVCRDAKSLAALDYGNVYKLWDKKITFGCSCDKGYYGSDCSLRKCPIGTDPIFQDTDSSLRYSNWSYVIYSKSPPPITIKGNYSIIFYDIYGEDWRTDAIKYDASCLEVIDALEKLPNRIIPMNSVRCLKWNNYNAISSFDEPFLLSPNPYYGIKYTIAFPQNPGYLKQIQIDLYLDGSRPTLNSNESTSTLGTFVYPNGFQGSDIDYFSEKCDGLYIYISTTSSGYYDYVDGLTSFSTKLFQSCLLDADFNTGVSSGSNVMRGNTYNWDYGSIYNPHLVKLIPINSPWVTDLCNRTSPASVRDGGTGRTTCTFTDRQPGFIAALYYDSVVKKFKFLTRPSVDFGGTLSTTQFAVYTSKGVAQMQSDQVKIVTYASTKPYSSTIYSVAVSTQYPDHPGNVDCETVAPTAYGAKACVEKEAIVFVLDPSFNVFSYKSNPKYLNLYKVKRLYQSDDKNIRDKNRIILDMSIDGGWQDNPNDNARLYVWYPNNGGYNVVSECSNRGLCDTTTGLCTCFKEFQGGSCEIINNIKK
jgi:hypothetical protein